MPRRSPRRRVSGSEFTLRAEEGADRVVSAITPRAEKRSPSRERLASRGHYPRLVAETKKSIWESEIGEQNDWIYDSYFDGMTAECLTAVQPQRAGVLLTQKKPCKLFGPEGGSVINIGPVSARFPAEFGTIRDESAAMQLKLCWRRSWAAQDSRELDYPGIDETEGVHTAGFARAISASGWRRNRRLGHRQAGRNLRRRGTWPRSIRNNLDRGNDPRHRRIL